jgi:uncharacterized protein YbjQ (UPF0145 family)
MEITMPQCSNCNYEKSFFEMSNNSICIQCEVVKTHNKENEKSSQELVEWNNISKKEKKKYVASGSNTTFIPQNELNELLTDVILTTSINIAGREIDHEIEVITAECVYGMHMFKDMFAAFRDFFGGRSKVVQDTLRDARRTVLTELRREALVVGADAVIAIDLDYQELSGGGKNGMLMLVASGTAVSLK